MRAAPPARRPRTRTYHGAVMVSAGRLSTSVALALLASAACGFELPRPRFQRRHGVDDEHGQQHQRRLGSGNLWPTTSSSRGSTSRSSHSRSSTRSSSSKYSVGHPRCTATSLGAGKTSPTADLAATDSYASDLKRTGLWVAAAAAFAGGLAATKGADAAVEFCSGYILEQCLSVDNLFVFLVLFDYFGVTRDKQNRVLSYGIWGAIILRGLFIGVGAVTLQSFHQVTTFLTAGGAVATVQPALTSPLHAHTRRCCCSSRPCWRCRRSRSWPTGATTTRCDGTHVFL